MNERGEGSGQDSCVAPKGDVVQPRTRVIKGVRGPEPQEQRDSRPDPNCPAHLQQGRSCCAPCLGRCREPTGRGAPLGLRGCGGDGTRCPPQELPRLGRGTQGAPSLLQSRVPGAPKPGSGSAQDGAKRAPRMEKPVLTKPTGAGAGEHGPAGPGAPTGRQGEGRRRWRAPQRPRRRTLNPSAKSARRGAPEPPGGRRMRGLWGEHARPESSPSY